MSAASSNTAYQQWRFHLVWALLIMLLLVLCARVIMLQLVDMEGGYKFLQQQGKARTVRTEVINAHRGIIYDRKGEPLAVSTPVQSVWCNPKEVSVDDGNFKQLAQALDYSQSALARKLEANQDRTFLYLRRQLPPEEAKRALDAGVEGVYVEDAYKRYYPAGEVASHVVGFTNIDDSGQEGMELTFDQHLRGLPGAKQVVKDLNGKSIRNFKHVRSAEPGGQLHLSIDLRIQYLAYRALKEAVVNHRASSGSMVIVDVDTGDILALVNQPSFNPNNRGEFTASRMRNRAIVDLIEPGSTVKPFTIIAALESGRYTPNTQIDTNPGYIRVGRKVQRDHRNYGVIDLTTLIAKSSNVATTKIALNLDPEDMRSVFYRLGLGQSTGTGFPGEAVGVLPNHQRWRDIEKATFAFGYGLSITPLQLAQAYSTLANGGIKKPLRILKSDAANTGERVVDAGIAADVLDMLKAVTRKGGTAAQAAIPAYSFSGKTGTVHKVGAGGYQEDHYISLFAGMAPSDNPRLVGVVVVNDPKGEKYYGGAVAAPVFSRVAADALRLMGVVPDKLEDFKGHDLLAVDTESYLAKRG
jgi:cell division protein FtsI (penicillin-binding protein 3)